MKELEKWVKEKVRQENERENLIELLTAYFGVDPAYYGIEAAHLADHLIANGVTVQGWIPASEPPKENGYYLCVILLSAVGNKKEYRRKILFWEDNVWIEMASCFRTVKPLYWMPMAEMPQPPKGE